MTLHTRLAIVEPTHAREIFDACRRLLGGERVPFSHELSNWEPGVTTYRNKAGRGLPALLWVDYGADAPLVPDPTYADDPEERSYYPPVDGWSIMVHFDTAYAYRGENGGGCDDLHAWLVQQLDRWLTDRGLTWLWYHEYTGAWHPATDPATILGDPDLGRLPNEAVPA